MPDPRDEQHDQIRDAAVARLKADPAVAALVGDRVFPEDAATGAALPHLVVKKGRAWPTPEASAPVLAQRDLKVTASAADKGVLSVLLVAVNNCLSGHALPPHADRVVKTDTGTEEEDGGVFTRRFLFGCHVRPPAARSGGGSFGVPAPVADNDALRRENEDLRRRLAALEEKKPEVAAPEPKAATKRPARGGD